VANAGSYSYDEEGRVTATVDGDTTVTEYNDREGRPSPSRSWGSSSSRAGRGRVPARPAPRP